MLEWAFRPFSLSGLFGRPKPEDLGDEAAFLASREAPVPELREGLPRFRSELDRARRYQRPLSVLMVTPYPHRDDVPWPGSDRRTPSSTSDEKVLLETRLPHLASLLVGSILARTVRGSDRVTYRTADDRFVILLAEADQEVALRAVDRIEELMRTRAHLGVRVGIATFPEDGFTMNDLLGQAEEQWRRAALKIDRRPEGEAGRSRDTDR
jgi:hypothetical protein